MLYFSMLFFDKCFIINYHALEKIYSIDNLPDFLGNSNSVGILQVKFKPLLFDVGSLIFECKVIFEYS